MDILLACLFMFLGAFVQTSIGFGLAVVAAPVLYFINPAYVPIPITLAVLGLSLLNAFSFRKDVALGSLKSAIIGRVPGSLAGAALLLWIDKDLLALWIGISVLLAVAVSLSSLRWQPTAGRLMLAGFMSGFMGTSSSIGGPPMALVWQHQDIKLIRANLAAFFAVSCLVSLIVLLPTDYFRWQHVWLSLPLLPATLAGYLLARRTMHRLPHRAIRSGSLVLCSVSGIAAVLSFLMQ